MARRPQRDRAARRSPRLRLADQAARDRHILRQRVAATMRRYARLDEHDLPVRCTGFRTGSKIIFDSAERAEACLRSLTDRGLSAVRAVHACRRPEGETHFHLTRRDSRSQRD